MSGKLLLEDKKVLIADDDPFSRKVVTQMLEKLGCTAPLAVGDGETAELALKESGPFEIVILDFRMPSRNGLEILKNIRIGQGPCPREQRVMMLTASGDYALLGAAMALDADAFVVKPITLQQMAERLRGMFKQWGEFKTPFKYAEVNIEEVTRRLNATLPSVPRKEAPKPGQPRRGRLTRLEAVRPGSTLSEDICGPQNQLLVASGARLSQRLINRLVEVREVIEIKEIWVEAEQPE